MGRDEPRCAEMRREGGAGESRRISANLGRPISRHAPATLRQVEKLEALRGAQINDAKARRRRRRSARSVMEAIPARPVWRTSGHRWSLPTRRPACCTARRVRRRGQAHVSQTRPVRVTAMTTQACLAEIQATAASLFAAGGGGGGGGTASLKRVKLSADEAAAGVPVVDLFVSLELGKSKSEVQPRYRREASRRDLGTESGGFSVGSRMNFGLRSPAGAAARRRRGRQAQRCQDRGRRAAHLDGELRGRQRDQALGGQKEARRRRARTVAASVRRTRHGYDQNHTARPLQHALPPTACTLLVADDSLGPCGLREVTNSAAWGLGGEDIVKVIIIPYYVVEGADRELRKSEDATHFATDGPAPRRYGVWTLS